MMMFPKTSSSPWGFLQVGWNFTTWWGMVMKVLTAADKYRAFEIMIKVLEKLQEKSGAINQQMVWKDQGRIAKVRKALADWGEMDEEALTGTLEQYAIEM